RFQASKVVVEKSCRVITWIGLAIHPAHGVIVIVRHFVERICHLNQVAIGIVSVLTGLAVSVGEGCQIAEGVICAGAHLSARASAFQIGHLPGVEIGIVGGSERIHVGGISCRGHAAKLVIYFGALVQ